MHAKKQDRMNKIVQNIVALIGAQRFQDSVPAIPAVELRSPLIQLIYDVAKIGLYCSSSVVKTPSGDRLTCIEPVVARREDRVGLVYIAFNFKAHLKGTD